MCICICMVVFVCIYECMHTCICNIPSYVFFSMLICVFAIVILQAKRALSVLRSLTMSSWWRCFLCEGTYQGLLEQMLHCEASCEEYIVATRLVFCCIVHVCIRLLTLLLTHSGIFSFFHANKVMIKY